MNSMRRRQTLAVGVIATLSVSFGCVTSKREMAWVRTDGQRIGDDPALLQQGKSDIAFCHADLDVGAADEAARGCMAQKGYSLVGTSNNCHRSSGAPNLPANDSALFSFRFCAVHAKDVRDSQLRQLFEVPSCRKIRRRRRERHLRLNAGRHSLASKKNRRFRPPVEADGPSAVLSGR
jgi:hypothetical protein